MAIDSRDPRHTADTDLPPLLLQRDGHVAHLVLNRPGKLNAIDGTVLGLLRSAVENIEADADVRVVVLSASGRAFCAGADLDFVRQQLTSSDDYAAFLREWHDVFCSVERCSKPTIAAVHGVALAGGLELTQVCDVVVAAADAEFGDQHARFGLFPGGGSTQRLPRLIGQRRARWLLLSGERFSASDALEYGMINRVVEPDALMAEAESMAHQLAMMSMSATSAIKRAVIDGAQLPLDAALALERSLAVNHMLGIDARLGLAAFESRTQPVFSGLAPTNGAIDGSG
jgi:enoyl-CoA hydratase/carnithine racemase